MYVLKHHFGGPYPSSHLYEMTAKEFREAKADDSPEEAESGVWHEHITGTQAHQWVKRGNIHSTPLYIDNGRVRYARDGY